MKSNTVEGVVILVILIVVMIVMLMGDSGSTAGPSNTSNSSENTSPSGKETVSTNSPHAQNISIGAGNAAYAYQSYEEYITIYNRGREPVDITNWQLKNGKDKRAYDLGGDLRYFPADTAKIGQAGPFVSPSGPNQFQNVVLKPSEAAIITTGKVGPQSPYNIVSFKENICSGYLEDLPEYAFTPPLTYNCPRPEDEPGVGALDTECRRFIERMPSCRTPEFNTRDAEGDICHNCVDSKLLSGACVAFIKNHFNYSSCITNHANDPGFSNQTHTWRIFLGIGWEMWAKEYETIELFDQLGRLVDSRSY